MQKGATMFDPTTFVGFHTWLSLLAMASGIYVVAGLLSGRMMPGWTPVYLVTAVGTSVTGFGFPLSPFLPSHVVGILSLIVLAAAIVARYLLRSPRGIRWLYIPGIVLSEYFLVFVGVAQAFSKIGALSALAPTQTEPPFAITQLVVLAIFAVLGVIGVRGFRTA